MDVLSLVPFSRKLYLTPLEQVTKKRKIFILFLQAHQSGQFEDPSILQPHLLTLEGVCVCVCVLVVQLCPTLCDPMDCSLPGSSVCRILQARILEWVAVPFPEDLPDPEIEPDIAGRFFTI